MHKAGAMLYPELSHLLSSERDTEGIILWYFGGDLPFLVRGCLGLVSLRVEGHPVWSSGNFLVVIEGMRWVNLSLEG